MRYGPECRRPCGLSPLLVLRLIEINGRGHRQACDHRLRWRPVEGDTNGHSLGDLDPIAIGVLRREQRELTTGTGADALDMGIELLARIGIDLDGGALARDHL